MAKHATAQHIQILVMILTELQQAKLMFKMHRNRCFHNSIANWRMKQLRKLKCVSSKKVSFSKDQSHRVKKVNSRRQLAQLSICNTALNLQTQERICRPLHQLSTSMEPRTSASKLHTSLQSPSTILVVWQTSFLNQVAAIKERSKREICRTRVSLRPFTHLIQHLICNQPLVARNLAARHLQQAWSTKLPQTKLRKQV